MPELRQNVITREWVIIAPERAKRPDEFVRKIQPDPLPAYVPSCPFCPGNERMTPPETFVVPGANGWVVRVAPNKFPVLASEGDLLRTVQGIRRTVSGVGLHEVIVETPEHNKTTALLDDQQVERIIETYLNRFRFASADPRMEQVTIFKNHGEAAGTSLAHPHSQIIAVPIITPQVRERMVNALRHFDEFGECIFCHMLEQELKEGVRLVLETEYFVSFIQFGSLSPFSPTILPRRHMACLSQMTDAEAADLARNLRRTLAKLYFGLSDPDYNYTVRTLPMEFVGVRHYHWYLHIIPRLTKVAGFELGSGIFVNPAVPEDNAAFLRGLQVA